MTTSLYCAVNQGISHLHWKSPSKWPNLSADQLHKQHSHSTPATFPSQTGQGKTVVLNCRPGVVIIAVIICSTIPTVVVVMAQQLFFSGHASSRLRKWRLTMLEMIQEEWRTGDTELFAAIVLDGLFSGTDVDIPYKGLLSTFLTAGEPAGCWFHHEKATLPESIWNNHRLNGSSSYVLVLPFWIRSAVIASTCPSWNVNF